METDIPRLLARIDSEFDFSRDKLRSLRQQAVAEIRGRQERLALFEKVCRMLPPIWEPRLEALRQRLGERLKVPVQLQTSRRQAEVSFTSSLARVRAAFTATTDPDVTMLTLEYSLTILPNLLSLPARDLIAQPVERIDDRATAAWIDDRVVGFVKSYLSLYETDYCLGGHIVEDPVTHVRFPRFAAAAILDRHGKTFYFMSSGTLEEFEARATGRPVGAPDA